MDEDLSTVILSSSFDTRYRFVLAFQYRWFKVNQHPVSEVIPVLLKSGQSASREEAVEKRNICRSMQNSWHRSIWMPERGASIFQDHLKPKSHTKLPKYPWTTRNPIYVFLSHCWRQQAFYYPILLFSLRFGEKINSPSEIDWNSIGFIIDFLSIILFRLWFVLLLACLSNSSC